MVVLNYIALYPVILQYWLWVWTKNQLLIIQWVVRDNGIYQQQRFHKLQNLKSIFAINRLTLLSNSIWNIPHFKKKFLRKFGPSAKILGIKVWSYLKYLLLDQMELQMRCVYQTMSERYYLWFFVCTIFFPLITTVTLTLWDNEIICLFFMFWCPQNTVIVFLCRKRKQSLARCICYITTEINKLFTEHWIHKLLNRYFPLLPTVPGNTPLSWETANLEAIPFLWSICQSLILLWYCTIPLSGFPECCYSDVNKYMKYINTSSFETAVNDGMDCGLFFIYMYIYFTKKTFNNIINKCL